MSDHALIGPSSSHKWWTGRCTGSVVLEATVDHDTSTEYSDYGSKGHELASDLLTATLTNTEWTLSESQTEDSELKDVVQPYVDFVYDTQKQWIKDGFTNISGYNVEQRVKFTDSNWGTADYWSVHERDGRKVLLLIDLKLGEGVLVEAKDNPQLLNYALAILKQLKEQQGILINDVVAYIYQPRVEAEEKHSSWFIDTKTLYTAYHTLELRLREMQEEFDGKRLLEFNVGEHCQFCKAKFKCKTYLESTQVANVVDDNRDFGNILGEIPHAKLLEMYNALPRLSAFSSSLKRYVEELVLTGRCEVPGLKVVPVRQVRKWALPPKEMAVALVNAGVEHPYKQDIIGIGEAEKLLGKKHEIFETHTVKTKGGFKVVPDTDSRPAISSDVAPLNLEGFDEF